MSVLGFAEKIERAVREDAYKSDDRSNEGTEATFDFSCTIPSRPVARYISQREMFSRVRQGASLSSSIPTGFIVDQDNTMLDKMAKLPHFHIINND